MYQSTPAIIFWLGKKLSNCILCLKYFTCEGGIFPNRWSENFEHTTHTNSKTFGPPFAYTLKTTSVCALFQVNDEEQIYPLFEILNLWRRYFPQSLKWIFWALNTYKLHKKWSPFCEPAEKHFCLCNFPREWRSAPESSVWNTSLMNELFFTLTEVIFLSFKC